MEIKFNLEPENFCCEHALMADILNNLTYINKRKSGHFSSIAVLAYDETIEKLFKAFCQLKFKDDTELSFHHLDYNYVDYEGEYAFLVTLEDCYVPEITISIEKAIHEDGDYNLYYQDWLYIDETCSDELVKKHLQFKDNMDIFYIDDECESEEFDKFESECGGDCENCELNVEDDFDEFSDLYDVVESMVESILEEKFTRN